MPKINENDADHLLKMAAQLYMLAQICDDNQQDIASRLRKAGSLVSEVGADVQLLTTSAQTAH